MANSKQPVPIAPKSALPFPISSYLEASANWPEVGNHILACFNSATIVVYIAVRESVANYASAFQNFKGQQYYVNWRLRPSFLSAIYSSGWCTKTDQENMLAITMSREGFEKILQMSVAFRGGPNPQIKVEWEPDRYPFGEEMERSALVVTLRKDILERTLRDWIISIKDITNFIRVQRKFLLESKLDYIMVPDEVVYTTRDETVAEKIGLDKPVALVLPDYEISRGNSGNSSDNENCYSGCSSEADYYSDMDRVIPSTVRFTFDEEDYYNQLYEEEEFSEPEPMAPLRSKEEEEAAAEEIYNEEYEQNSKEDLAQVEVKN